MKNEFTVTGKKFMLWTLENMVKPPKLYFKFYWTLFAALTMVLLCMGGNVPFNLLIFGYCIYRAFIYDFVVTYGLYRRMVQTYQTNEWTRNISFNANDIIIRDIRNVVEYQYSDLVSIKEKGNKIWLATKNKTVIRMYTDTFVNGDWEQCKKLLKEKNSNLK